MASRRGHSNAPVGVGLGYEARERVCICLSRRHISLVEHVARMDAHVMWLTEHSDEVTARNDDGAGLVRPRCRTFTTMLVPHRSVMDTHEVTNGHVAAQRSSDIDDDEFYTCHKFILFFATVLFLAFKQT